MSHPSSPGRLLLCALLVATATLRAQEQRPIALVNARILTMTDAGTIEKGTVLIRDGKIEAVGPDVKAPLGAQVIDVAGGTVMPGLVHAWSSAGIESAARPMPMPQQPQQRGRGRGRGPTGPMPSGGGNANRAAARVSDGIYARQDVFTELLREGVTSLFVHPSGGGFPGLGARIEPDGTTHDDLIVDAEALSVVMPATNAGAKKLIKDEFDKAKKALEERKKPKEAPKPPEEQKPAEQKPAEGQPKPGEQKPAEPAKEPPKPEGGEKPPEAKPEAKPQEPEKKPEVKKDPNVEVLADVLDGKRKTFVRLSTAMDLAHWLDGVGDLRFPAVVVADQPASSRGRLEELASDLKKVCSGVLLTPALAELPWTRTLVNPAKTLHDAGLEIGFVLPDDAARLRGLRFALMELVRAGLPADVALKAITAVPAKMLGVDGEVGSVAQGHRADLLVFDRDPLDPTASLRQVFLRGRAVEEAVSR
ncbi:MAG: amidohydrolase family protein [Planctomycetota bacterium]